MRRYRPWVGLLVLVLTPWNPVRADDTPAGFSNGLSTAERAAFYHLAEGSEVFPLDWLRVLDSKMTGRPFLENMERFGFLADPDDPNGLPVGLAAARVRGLEPLGPMVGLNCAACHVGEITVQGQKLRIDGGPNLVDTRAFFKDLAESAVDTVEDPAKLLRFLARLYGRQADALDAPSPSREMIRAIIQNPFLQTPLKEVVRRIRDRAPAPDDLEFRRVVRDVNVKPDDFRKKWLDRFDGDEALAPLRQATAVLAPVRRLIERADGEGALTRALEDAYINVRLLKARGEFLKRLKSIGESGNTVWGPGRVDAFGSARALLFEEGYDPRAAVSYPHLWLIRRTPYYHYDNNTNSIIERNFGQALGVGAVFDDVSFASTLQVENVYQLEKLAWKIKPPVWPEKVLGKINQDLAAKGEKLFSQTCSKCHERLDPAGTNAADDQVTKLDAIGTDPNRGASFAETLPNGKAFPDVIGDAMEKVRKKALAESTLTDQEKEELTAKEVKWRGPKAYGNRPLNGVWATAPYLHNGSVPTLDDLLRPAKARPTKFYVGSREFDPAKVGYVTAVQGREPNFDTAGAGNANAGHEYGTDLGDDDRQALLEYLKTL